MAVGSNRFASAVERAVTPKPYRRESALLICITDSSLPMGYHPFSEEVSIVITPDTVSGSLDLRGL